MKKILTLVLFTLFTLVVFAQSKLQDVVYLKNGSIIRGIIIEQVPNKSIKIETADKSVFVYQLEEIEKLVKETIVSKNTLNALSVETGYKGILELGYQIGDGMGRLKLNFINGSQINPTFSLGFGTGVRYYYDAQMVLIPIFGDFRANFINYQISNQLFPYLSVGVGYSFDATYSFEPTGFLFEPAVGLCYVISDKSLLNFGLGFEVQGYYGSSLNALSFNVGISF